MQSIDDWLTEPGTDVAFTDNRYTCMPMGRIDEDLWFRALSSGIFSDEFGRQAIRQQAWLDKYGDYPYYYLDAAREPQLLQGSHRW